MSFCLLGLLAGTDQQLRSIFRPASGGFFIAQEEPDGRPHQDHYLARGSRASGAVFVGEGGGISERGGEGARDEGDVIERV